MKMRNIRTLVLGIVTAIVLMVVASYWGEFFSRTKLEYRLEALRLPAGISPFDLYLTILTFRNSGRVKLANVPIKCHSEKPDLRPVGVPVALVKNKPYLGSKSLDMSAFLEWATALSQELGHMKEMMDSEYFPRLESETPFSIEALDPGSYYVYYVAFFLIPSEQIVLEDHINLISPDANVNLSRVQKLSEPVSIWSILFATSVVINGLLVSYWAIRKKRERQGRNL